MKEHRARVDRCGEHTRVEPERDDPVDEDEQAKALVAPDDVGRLRSNADDEREAEKST